MTSTGQTMGLRARKKLETHRALAAAALRLVAERGLDNVTAEDISAEAGVSPRTFFNYFACKEDAILVPFPDAEERSERAVRRLLAAPAELSPLEAIMAMVAEEMATFDDDREEWLTRFAVVDKHPSLLSRIVSAQLTSDQTMIDAIAERLGLDGDRDLYPALLFSVVSGAVKATVRTWHHNGGRQPIAELLRTAFDAIAEGLPAPRRDHNEHRPRGGTA
ncbi:TetR/AcrR family transcriptional regulator [Allokutzneria oryzae]|uniref:TetR/AcrR family transcriptional regulator n=1 Tax=Allokutzneria oryzae TaxID=1378989 RepID=A0ABV5ZQF3_9PSEU